MKTKTPMKWHVSENREESGGIECTGEFTAIWTDAKTGKVIKYRCQSCGKEVSEINFKLYGLKP